MSQIIPFPSSSVSRTRPERTPVQYTPEQEAAYQAALNFVGLIAPVRGSYDKECWVDGRLCLHLGEAVAALLAVDSVPVKVAA